MQENIKLLEKYQVQKEDWKDMSLVHIKMKAESTVALFIALENMLAPHISPIESELIENTKNQLLEYLENFINKKL